LVLGNQANPANVVLRSCTVTDNRAGIGGGLYAPEGNTVVLRNCKINFNAALFDGGGVAAGGALRLLNCFVHNNAAEIDGREASSRRATL
jgi:hypothetical protein